MVVAPTTLLLLCIFCCVDHCAAAKSNQVLVARATTATTHLDMGKPSYETTTKVPLRGTMVELFSNASDPACASETISPACVKACAVRGSVPLDPATCCGLAPQLLKQCPRMCGLCPSDITAPTESPNTCCANSFRFDTGVVDAAPLCKQLCINDVACGAYAVDESGGCFACDRELTAWGNQTCLGYATRERLDYPTTPPLPTVSTTNPHYSRLTRPRPRPSVEKPNPNEIPIPPP